MIKAKFTVVDVALHKDADGKVFQEDVSMRVVVDGSDENKSFSLHTPNGETKLTITNPEAFGKFRQGVEYYVDFTPATL